MAVGKSEKRVDAYDKVTGKAQYTDDLCDSGAYVARALHAAVAHGKVLSIDTSEAEKVEGVVKILTCFDLKEKHYYATPGHPWVADTKFRDIEDRLILTDMVRFYGDDIGAVVAENALAAARALDLIKVRYEEYPFVMDVQEAMSVFRRWRRRPVRSAVRRSAISALWAETSAMLPRPRIRRLHCSPGTHSLSFSGRKGRTASPCRISISAPKRWPKSRKNC